jgi:site-specific DNA recombinase
MPSTNGHGPTPERVALYLRVSSEEQREAGTIHTQHEFLESYCALHGLNVVETYADDGVSGTIPLGERPEGRRLLDEAKEGKFVAVLVYRLDRLGRALLVVVDAHDRLEALGVGLVSATEHVDTTTPSGRLHFQMLGSFSEFERASIKQRTLDGLHRAHRKGRYMGPVPLGYRADEDGRLEIVPEEAEIVREIISNIAAGSTLYSEAARLNALDIRPPSWKYASDKKSPPAKRWRAPTIRIIVRQTAYSGLHKVTLSTGEVVEQRVPAIVEPELQKRARTRLEENRRYSGGRPHRRYLLSGLITCEECGCSCVGHTHSARGKKYPYYHCNDDSTQRLHRAPRGHAPYVRAGWLEEVVWADVRQFLHDPGAILERIREQTESDTASTELEARHTDLTKRLASKHEERDRWLHLYVQGRISEDELETHLEDVRVTIDNLRLLLESVEADLTHRYEQAQFAENAEAWLMALRERLAEVEGESEEAYQARRELVKLLVAGITAGKQEDGRSAVQITYRFGPPVSSDEDELVVDGVKKAPAQLALKQSSNCAGDSSRMPPIWNAPAL